LVPPGGGSGFAAEVSKNGNDYVIAFRGTNFDLANIAGAAVGLGDLATSMDAVRGARTEQLRRAIEVVARVQAFPNVRTITLTGHSLGGGIPSVMSVFFNLPAVTFATAP